MADVAASVLARLKNKAAESGRSYQLCLQLFCQEEFLRRLEKSKYAENLVLKGGLFIYALTDFDSRVTMDVDFLLRRIPNTPEQLRAVMEEIIAAPTENDFITFEIKSVEPISVAKKYAGVGASLITVLIETKRNFTKADEAQLSAYVEYEKRLTGNKTVAVLANTTNEDVRVWRGVVSDSDYMPKETTLRTMDVNVLYFKDENDASFNKYIALFICAILRKEKYRYSYGRKWVLESMRSTVIKLPATVTSKPDYMFMENYMKSLPYGDRI